MATVSYAQPDDTEWTERSNDTFEIIAKHKGKSGYVERKVVYRFWKIEDDDWKLQIVDSEEPNYIGPILLPKKVIDAIIKATVKEELKK